MCEYSTVCRSLSLTAWHGTFFSLCTSLFLQVQTTESQVALGTRRNIGRAGMAKRVRQTLIDTPIILITVRRLLTLKGNGSRICPAYRHNSHLVTNAKTIRRVRPLLVGKVDLPHSATPVTTHRPVQAQTPDPRPGAAGRRPIHVRRHQRQGMGIPGVPRTCNLGARYTLVTILHKPCRPRKCTREAMRRSGGPQLVMPHQKAATCPGRGEGLAQAQWDQHSVRRAMGGPDGLAGW